MFERSYKNTSSLICWIEIYFHLTLCVQHGDITAVLKNSTSLLCIRLTAVYVVSLPTDESTRKLFKKTNF